MEKCGKDKVTRLDCCQ